MAGQLLLQSAHRSSYTGQFVDFCVCHVLINLVLRQETADGGRRTDSLENIIALKIQEVCCAAAAVDDGDAIVKARVAAKENATNVFITRFLFLLLLLPSVNPSSSWSCLVLFYFIWF